MSCWATRWTNTVFITLVAVAVWSVFSQNKDISNPARLWQRLTSRIWRLIDLLQMQTCIYLLTQRYFLCSDTSDNIKYCVILQSDGHVHFSKGNSLLISSRSLKKQDLDLIQSTGLNGWIVNSFLIVLLSEQVDPTGKSLDEISLHCIHAPRPSYPGVF